MDGKANFGRKGLSQKNLSMKRLNYQSLDMSCIIRKVRGLSKCGKNGPIGRSLFSMSKVGTKTARPPLASPIKAYSHYSAGGLRAAGHLCLTVFDRFLELVRQSFNHVGFLQVMVNAGFPKKLHILFFKKTGRKEKLPGRMDFPEFNENFLAAGFGHVHVEHHEGYLLKMALIIF